MPTYEYECKSCKYRFEEFQSITADPLKKCPKCRKNQLQRLIGAGSGIIFKGSGFYITDYKRGSPSDGGSPKSASSSASSCASSDGSSGSGGKSSQSSSDAGSSD